MKFTIYIGDHESWNPYLSFFKIRFLLSKNAIGTISLSGGEGIAPNMFFGDSLFQSMKVSCNGVCLNEQTDYCHQISALRQRLNKPDQWLETIGASTNFTQESHLSRVSEVASNHTKSRLDFTEMDREALGFDAAGNTIALAANTGIITFAAAGGDPLPNLNDAFRVGDEIDIADSNNGNRRTNYTIRIVNNIASTLTVSGQIAAIAANGGANGIFVTRRNDGLTRSNAREYEALWKPGLGLFQEINYPLPGGCTYEVMLTPFPSSIYKKYAIESGNVNKTPAVSNTTDNDYQFQVININMYVCKGYSSNPSPKQDMEISFDQIRAQTQTLNTNNLTQKNYDVHPFCHSLSIAYQQNGSGQDTRFSRGRFKLSGNQDLEITRIYVQYASMTLPNPIPDLDYNRTANKDFLLQRYLETQLYSKGIMHPSVEPLQKYYDRGPIYHWRWPRSMEKGHTSVVVNQNFRNAFGATRPQVFLFDWVKKTVMFKMSNNKVSHVLVSQ